MRKDFNLCSKGHKALLDAMGIKYGVDAEGRLYLTESVSVREPTKNPNDPISLISISHDISGCLDTETAAEILCYRINENLSKGLLIQVGDIQPSHVWQLDEQGMMRVLKGLSFGDAADKSAAFFKKNAEAIERAKKMAEAERQREQETPKPVVLKLVPAA